MNTRHSPIVLLALLAGFAMLTAGLLLSHSVTQAQDSPRPSFHPTFELRGSDGSNVQETGAPISTLQTCGSCHDTTFIATHSHHADAGASSLTQAGDVPGGREWETSAGWYGGWNPLLYVYAPLASDASTSERAAWLQAYGARHVGGGPVADLVEMNCFLCHSAGANNSERTAALSSGAFAWANTATLAGTGIVSHSTGDAWSYLPEAFNADGSVRQDLIRVQDPTSEACGQCHGMAETDPRAPIALTPGQSSAWDTLTTGQVFAAQRLVNSGLNLQAKPTLGRSFDIHAERAVACVDCHYAVNNPVYFTESAGTRPDHLVFDPRRMDFGDYLYRPLHEFANSSTGVDRFGASRTCASCHDAVSTHTWLPYTERHLNTVACESCHVPVLYGPAVESIDWTVLRSDGQPLARYRGIEIEGSNTLLTGFQPVLLSIVSRDGLTRLSPYNLITATYWVADDPAHPVAHDSLRAAWFEDDAYAPEVLAAFDANRDGALDDQELRLDSEAKVALIAQRLASQGVNHPQIVSDIQPYAIHHNVTQGEWATRECRTCHGEESRLSAPITLASFTPTGADPTVVHGDPALSISVMRQDDGSLSYRTNTAAPPLNLYVLGHDSVAWIDAFGMLAFLGVFAGVVIHGGLRFLALRRHQAHAPVETRQVYMYSVYERQWHWLQTVAIFGLLVTGLVIHRPTLFSMFAFDWVVPVHNALAVVLVINAALAAFYHFVSGEIRQFLPRPYGFFDQMFAQARYYLRGIFKGEAHPFEKTPEHKLNPLQQVTYLVILNVLLPLQIITGALMWGLQRLPQVTEQLGGLAFLAPFHTLIAWLFATFIVLHVYLTTTGHTPLASIRAMMLGWDEVETSPASTRSAPAAGEGVGS
jgi:thiosulfate reductase cytochrome b subunit